MQRGRIDFVFQLHFTTTNEALHKVYIHNLEQIINDSEGTITQKTIERVEGDLVADITADADSPKAFWTEFRRKSAEYPELLNLMIVVCEGDEGWDDYKLLHHYDVAQRIDELS